MINNQFQGRFTKKTPKKKGIFPCPLRPNRQQSPISPSSPIGGRNPLSPPRFLFEFLLNPA